MHWTLRAESALRQPCPERAWHYRYCYSPRDGAAAGAAAALVDELICDEPLCSEIPPIAAMQAIGCERQ